MSNPSERYFEFCERASVVQAGSNVIMIEIRKLGNDLIRCIARREITENQAYRYPGSLNARLAPKHVRRALYMILPFYVHVPSSTTQPMLTANAGQGRLSLI